MSDIGKRLADIAPIVIFHPITYWRTLAQLGHEPLMPYLGPSFPFSSTQIYFYPNAFAYLKHIRVEDGFFGMYRGFGQRLCCSFVGKMVSQTTLEAIEDKWQKREEVKDDDTEVEAWKKILTTCTIESASQSVGIIISYPFHVLMVRSMAQFIGKEHIYDSAFGGASEIYNNEGIMGFFAGLAPRLVGEVLTIFIAKTLIHVMRRYIVKEKDAGPYGAIVNLACNLVASASTYSYFTVSTVMIVNGCGLVAGVEPVGRMTFPNWREAYCYLTKKGAAKRGNSMFSRKAISTQID